MSKTLKIADGLSVPLAAVTEKIAWLGRTGSGKTYGAMKLAEAMLEAAAQIGVIDPVGVWRALRVPATGGRSFDVVVFGGLYGDVPLEPSSAAGELVADLVVERGLSFILDISQFIPAEQQRFLQGFTHRFFHRKKSAPSAVHLFMEECQEYIPENPSGAESVTLGHMQRLWKLGRNFGIGGSLISQRPQEIAKKALNMSGTLFAFQMTGPQERKAIKAWVADQGVATDIEAILQKLVVGQPHVESPTFLGVSKTVRILPRVTADLSSTPKVGTAAAARRDLTPIDVEQLRAAMADTVERAKADDPKGLRKRIAELERQTKAVEIQQASRKSATEIRDVPVLTDADRELLRSLHRAIDALAERLAAPVLDLSRVEAALASVLSEATAAQARNIEQLGALLETNALQAVIGKLDRITPSPIPGRPVSGPATAPLARRPAQANPKPAALRQPADACGAARLEPAKQRLLNALAWLEQLRAGGWSREVVAFVAGASSRSSSFANNVSALRTGGFVEYPQQNLLALTTAGQRQALPPESLLTPADLHAQIEMLLEPAQWRLVRAVIDAYPRALTRDGLAAAAGASPGSSSFANNVSRIRTLGLIDYPRQGWVVGTPMLFLEPNSGLSEHAS